MKMTYSVLTIADEVLKIAKRDGAFLTPMQLVKLVYIAHGWSLAILDRDLFNDRIEAWKYGPVIPKLYHATKQFGRNPIPADLINEDSQSEVEPEIIKFLSEVVEKYGNLSGIELSQLTHLPGTPWDEVYEPNVLGKDIPDDLIKQHYSDKLNENRNTAA